MAALQIERVLDTRFEFSLDGGDIISSDQNRLFTDGNFCHFKTATGANIVKEQNITFADLTVIDTFGGTGTFNSFANIQAVWIKLIELKFFDGLATGAGGGGSTTFLGLTDTPTYFGNNGKVLIANESELKLEYSTFYNFKDFIQLDDVSIASLIDGKILGVTLVSGVPKVTLIEKPVDGTTYFSAVGGFDYDDAETSVTPISFTGTEVKLTNDTLGPSTFLSKPPYGITGVWSDTLNSFDFSQLDEGDEVILSIDIDNTTTATNQTSKLYLKYTDDVDGALIRNIDTNINNKTIGVNNITRTITFYVKDSWKNNVVDLYYFSDANSTIEVNGWHPYIIRKSINILDVTGYAGIELYANLANLIAGQGDQNTYTFYEINDASGFTDVVSGTAWVRYLGTTVGDETDYIIVYGKTPIEVEIQGFNVLTKGKTDISILEVGDKFRGWDNDRYVVGKVIDAAAILPTDLDDNAKIKLVTDNTINPF